MVIFDDLKRKLQGNGGSKDLLTDDERELREYENYYTPQSGVADGTYAEFVVSDVFSISGRGTVVTGTVTGGVFSVGDRVIVDRGHSGTVETEIVGIEQFRKVCNSVSEGANAGFILKDVERKQIGRNDIIKKL